MFFLYRKRQCPFRNLRDTLFLQGIAFYEQKQIIKDANVPVLHFITTLPRPTRGKYKLHIVSIQVP